METGPGERLGQWGGFAGVRSGGKCVEIEPEVGWIEETTTPLMTAEGAATSAA